jgi:hypothetical protein
MSLDTGSLNCRRQLIWLVGQVVVASNASNSLIMPLGSAALMWDFAIGLQTEEQDDSGITAANP